MFGKYFRQFGKLKINEGSSFRKKKLVKLTNFWAGTEKFIIDHSGVEGKFSSHDLANNRMAGWIMNVKTIWKSFPSALMQKSDLIEMKLLGMFCHKQDF